MKKTYTYFQVIVKAPVKFQTDQHETVGGVGRTMNLLEIRNHAPRNTENKAPPPAYLWKGGGQKGRRRTLSFVKLWSVMQMFIKALRTRNCDQSIKRSSSKFKNVIISWAEVSWNFQKDIEVIDQVENRNESSQEMAQLQSTTHPRNSTDTKYNKVQPMHRKKKQEKQIHENTKKKKTILMSDIPVPTQWIYDINAIRIISHTK